MRQRVTPMSALVLAAIIICACGSPNPVEQDIRSVQERTIPAGGRLTAAYSAQREGTSLRATWEIETDMSWEAYSRWIAPRLADFQQRASPDGTLRFARILEGDSYSVVFKRKGQESERLAIQASFEASPF